MTDLARSASVPIVHPKQPNHEERRNTLPTAAPLESQVSVATISHRIPHQLVTKNLFAPTPCTYCKRFIWGFSKHALSCAECGLNWHPGCETHAAEDCGLTSDMVLGALAVKRDDSSVSGKDTLRKKEKKLAVQYHKGHIFRLHTYQSFTWCTHCTQFIWGFAKQGWKCQRCDWDCHTRCVPLVEIECSLIVGGELKVVEGGEVLDVETSKKVQEKRTGKKVKPILFSKNGKFKLKGNFMKSTPSPKGDIAEDENDKKEPVPSVSSTTAPLRRPLNSEKELVNVIEKDTSFSQAFETAVLIRERRSSVSDSTNSDESPGDDYLAQKFADFEIDYDRILGSGQFGTVRKAKNKVTNTPMAVKIIDKKKFWGRKNTQKLLKREIAIMSSIKHPNIVRLFAVFDEPNDLYLFMELVKGGDLLSYVEQKGHLNEDEGKFIFHQLCCGVKYLHDIGVVHRDLKPENLLLCEEDGVKRVKIADFGFANIIGEETFLKSVVGTPAYVAPEILKKATKGYQKSADLWSLGVILYACLSGVFPFDEDEPAEEQIRQGKFCFPDEYWHHVSDQAIDLICHLLVPDPKDRFSIDDVIKHPWFSINNRLQL